MRYGKTELGHMWHALKNDGKALCNKNLVITTATAEFTTVIRGICNSCEAKAQLGKNRRLLYPENVDGAGI